MDTASTFTHIINGKPGMVDVSHKEFTMREAVAVSSILVPIFVTAQLDNGELITKKGPVFHTAIIAGTMAAKNTATIIPLAHTIRLTDVKIVITIPKPGHILVECSVKCVERTGVEMEALTGASIAALTIYDMCKALTFAMEIAGTKLIKKSGGKNDLPSNP